MAIDTTRVANRRQLRFETVEDILADVEHLNGSKFKALGNWSGGQILKHLATVMNSSIDGMPPMRLAWYMRLMARLMKGWLLSGKMPPGFKLKDEAATSFIPQETNWDEGLRLIRGAVRRQQTESKREPSPFLGPMTREDWNRLHCRHAELHLSFLVPANN